MGLYYRHFRNRKIYRLATFATIEATGEEAVVYQAMYGGEEAVVYQAMYGDKRFWIRTKENFFEEVLHEGNRVPRFQPVSEEVALKEIE